MAENDWQGTPPCLFHVVTGFFPETSPKETWETNPRPLLVCGVAEDTETSMYFCRVAYGTPRLESAYGRGDDLVIGNLAILDQLGLKKPTRFVVNKGRQMAILPWTDEFFRPWTGYKSPILSILPHDMQRHVGNVVARLDDLPQF